MAEALRTGKLKIDPSKKIKEPVTYQDSCNYIRNGGLADVAGALSSALAERGNEVALLMPYYKEVKKKAPKVEETGISVEVVFSGRSEKASLLRHTLADGLTVYFVAHDRYYERDELYGDSTGDYQDNAERFIFFCRAVVAAGRLMGDKIDIIHCHDWQTGLIPVYLRTLCQYDPAVQDIGTLFTIHNIAYQGHFWHWDMLLTGLSWDLFNWKQLEYYGHLNFLKAGLVFSDVLNTVSPRYAQEIQTKAFGRGMEGVLQGRRRDLHGIVNGIDYGVWNPAIDPHIAANYNETTVWQGKPKCKQALQQMHLHFLIDLKKNLKSIKGIY